MHFIDARYLEAWHKKPLLRTIYHDFHRRIAENCIDGPTLEIGSGISRFPYTVKTDIQGSHCDVISDAHQLPFSDGSFSNIVMVDVLHHLECPARFLNEARRVLKENGRLVMIEPAITFGSTLFYRLLHDEPVIMRSNPFSNPHRANQAIPTLIIRYIKILKVEWFSFLTYPLSGGYKRWTLLPSSIGRALLRIERYLEPVGSWLAFRMLIVIENNGDSAYGGKRAARNYR